MKMKPSKVIASVRETLEADPRVVFAYLHGSYPEGESPRDLDIAVFATPETDSFRLSTDLKIALHEKTGLPADFFDIQVINNLLREGDILALVFLRRVLDGNVPLVDKSEKTRTDFFEQYSTKYRQCEGLLQEVLK